MCSSDLVDRDVHGDGSVHGDFRVVINLFERVFILGVHLDTGAREDDVGRRMRRVGFNHSAIDVDRDGMDVVLRETSTQRHRGSERKAQGNFFRFVMMLMKVSCTHSIPPSTAERTCVSIAGFLYPVKLAWSQSPTRG